MRITETQIQDLVHSELGAVIMAKANEAVAGLVAMGLVNDTPEAKKTAYATCLEMIITKIIHPTITR